ncbi:UNVERIFIED_CONTAM: hypothetical protein GTU68_042531 [Idotea baltica]|nr:hypothetical protein [Idotea baltica]
MRYHRIAVVARVSIKIRNKGRLWFGRLWSLYRCCCVIERKQLHHFRGGITW